MSTGRMVKNAKDLIPFCDDQGMTNLVGTPKPGASIQYLNDWAMVSGGVVDFGDESLEDMDVSETKYCVFIQNQTDAADEGTVAAAAKLANQLTIVGPDVADVLDIMIVGTVKGQLS